MTRFVIVEGVKCHVIEDLGYDHDAGAYAKVVEHNGLERTVVRRPLEGMWRFWTAAVRMQPMQRVNRG
jgi:hypothetical protein